MTVFLCKSNFDGILCGVYDAYASKIRLEDCRLELEAEYEPVLFAEYRVVELEVWKAERVTNKIKSYMSEEAYMRLYRASLYKDPARADRILRFIRIGLQSGRRVMNMLQNPAVYEIFRMDRCVWREAHAWIEFLRFEKLRNGIYYAKVGAENQILEIVAAHFADRFADMPWVIYDETHKSAAVHLKYREWLLFLGITDDIIEKLMENEQEDEYQELWKVFFQTITIEERKNQKCQRTMLPIRYRKYMTEFQE